MRLYVMIILFVPFVTFSQNEHVITWSGDSELMWEDFNGNIDSTTNFQALTTWGISISTTKNSYGDLLFKIHSYFDKSESWVDPKHQSNTLLNHEQQHFNIAEIYARKLKKLIAKFKSEDLTQSKIKKKYDEILSLCKMEQEQYDLETNHGLKQKEQTKWNKRIGKNLKKLKKYKN